VKIRAIRVCRVSQLSGARPKASWQMNFEDFQKFLLLFLMTVIKTSGLVAGYLLVLFQKSFLKEFRLGASIPHGQASDRSEIVSE
jgi:hypothetical protein